MKTVTRVAALIGGASVLTIGLGACSSELSDAGRKAAESWCMPYGGAKAVTYGMIYGLRARYIREPDNDRRIGRGDDFAGDAWRDRQTGEIKYVAVGHNPNA